MEIDRVPGVAFQRARPCATRSPSTTAGERKHAANMAGFTLPNTRHLSREGVQLAPAHKWEECQGIGKSFGYNRMEGPNDYKSATALVHLLVDVVSKGGNLLLDIGPTADGRIPVIMQERLLQIGAWLKVNGEAIYGDPCLAEDVRGRCSLYKQGQHCLRHCGNMAWPGTGAQRSPNYCPDDGRVPGRECATQMAAGGREAAHSGPATSPISLGFARGLCFQVDCGRVGGAEDQPPADWRFLAGCPIFTVSRGWRLQGLQTPLAFGPVPRARAGIWRAARSGTNKLQSRSLGSVIASAMPDHEADRPLKYVWPRWGSGSTRRWHFYRLRPPPEAAAPSGERRLISCKHKAYLLPGGSSGTFPVQFAA